MKINKMILKYVYEKSSGALSDSNIPLYEYGISIGIELIISSFFSIAIAIFMNRIIETAFFYTVFISIRIFAGGLHLDEYWKCLLMSAATQILIISVNDLFKINMIIVLVVYLLSAIGIGKLSPLEPESKKLEKCEKIRLNRNIQYIICFWSLVEIALILYKNYRYVQLLMFSFALLFFILLIENIRRKVKNATCT